MFTYYKDITILTLRPSAKLGYEFDFIMELLHDFSILEILHFLKNIEYHFNIPLFNLIITPQVYNGILLDPNENYHKTIIIVKFLKTIKNYFLMENAISLINKITEHFAPFAQKINKMLTLKDFSFESLVLGQAYGFYRGSVIPFYVHTSSWYIRTGLMADVS
jgi:hypothetical protein